MKTEFPCIQTSDLRGEVIQRAIGNDHSLMPVFEENIFAGVLDFENISEYISIQNAINNY